MARNNSEMVMDVVFILHGKPNNQDIWGKTPFDGLENKVCTECFEQKECLPNRSYLVEIRSWKSINYGIYSFIQKVKDTSNRPSYCAITLIFKNLYCRKTNDIFALLTEVYEKKLIRDAKIIDSESKFKINWFNESVAALNSIEKLTIDCINSQFIGLFEEIGNSFSQSVQPLSSVLKYNPKDCDSEAFFDDLKHNGRLLITESIPSKDSLLAGNDSLRRAYDEAKRIADSVPALETSLQEAKDQIKKLQADKTSLFAEREQFKREKEEKEKIINELKGVLSDKEKEIDFAVEKIRQPLERIFSKMESARNDAKKSDKGWIRITPYIPIINLLLLLFLSFLTFRCFTNFDKKKEGESYPQVENVAAYNTAQSLKNIDSTSLSMATSSPSTPNEAVSQPTPAEIIVEQCGIQVKDGVGHIINNNSEVEKGTYLNLSVESPKEGYSWHISNGDFTPEEKIKASFTWKVNSTKQGDVIITYRPESEAAKKNNPNKIVLKIK